MTPQEAIEILKEEHDYAQLLSYVNEALNLGIEALKKQIPQKLDYEGNGYDENGELVYDAAYCRICEHNFEYGINDWGSKFCPNCGQALDWSDYE